MAHDNGLPPFDASAETLEQAVEQQLDFAAQLRFLQRQNTQLARRQDELNKRYHHLQTDVGRIADGQTRCNGLIELLVQQLKRLHKVEVPDVP